MIENKTQRLVVAGLCLALGILLPQVFHVIPVANTGNVFLPMHIPVILCGYFVGAGYGALIGAICPLLSFLFTGMPNAARLPFMIVELMAYGIAAGLVYQLLAKLNKTLRIYLTLIITMICGRIAYFAGLVVAVYILGMKELSVMAVISAVVLGLPGIVIQIIIIPVIIFSIDKLLNGKQVI